MPFLVLYLWEFFINLLFTHCPHKNYFSFVYYYLNINFKFLPNSIAFFLTKRDLNKHKQILVVN